MVVSACMQEVVSGFVASGHGERVVRMGNVGVALPWDYKRSGLECVCTGGVAL